MKLTVFAGLPGSGKTHAAMRLQRETGAVRISRDEIRARLFEPPDYSEDEKAAAFKVLLILAEHQLGRGNHVILEGMPFSRRQERGEVRRLAERTGAELTIYHCRCPDDEALRRIRAQAHMATDRDEALFYDVKQRFDPFDEDEAAVEMWTEV